MLFLEEQEIKKGIPLKKVDTELLEKEIRKTFPEITWISVYLDGNSLTLDITEKINTLSKKADGIRWTMIVEIESAKSGWGIRTLQRQYNSSLYERLALSRDKDAVMRLAREGNVIANPKDIVKQPTVLEFLGLEEKAEYSESDLETAIINKLQKFLLELGKGYLFEARQKRFTFNEDNYYVDYSDSLIIPILA